MSNSIIATYKELIDSQKQTLKAQVKIEKSNARIEASIKRIEAKVDEVLALLQHEDAAPEIEATFDQGRVWPSVDGKDALIVFEAGCSLVARNIDEPKWGVCALPLTMSDRIRGLDGDLSIEEIRDGDDVAIQVIIGKESFVYCSTLEAQRLLTRKPTMAFIGTDGSTGD